MKQYWNRLVVKVDSLSLRERLVIFAMVVVIFIVGFNTLVLDPQFVKQKQMSNQMKQDQAQATVLQAQMQQMLAASLLDPDKANKERLADLRAQAQQMQVAMQNMQKGLVSPDKMSAVLEDILRKNGRLRLVSLKTLPPISLSDLVKAEIKGAGEKPADAVQASKEVVKEAAGKAVAGSVYKHGVEIVVQGEYSDMLNYLAQLESMPWQLFWGKVKLNADEYPKSTLSLTVFTLSLDKRWLNL
jgi:MSHA biogenesis protein MshJ